MANDRLASWFAALQKHPVRVAAAVLAALLLSGLGFLRLSLDPSLTVMLPENSETLATITFLRDTDFSGKAVLSVHKSDPDVSQAEFIRAVEALAASLESPLVDRVVTGFKQEQVITEMGEFLKRAPELIDADDLKTMEARLTQKQINRKIRSKYMQLLKPQGSFMLSGLRSDPLDIRMDILHRLRDLATSFGYDLRVEDGHILSRDGNYAMVVIETNVDFTDSGKSKDLLALLNEQCAQLPDWAEVDIVCGHQHTVSNERVIKRDIRVTLTIVTIAFIALFVFYFRDPRAGAVFAIPMVAVVGALSLCAVVMGTLSPMAIGFGSVIAGIAVDYGIHIYIAVKRTASSADAVRRVMRPIVLGALTTSGVFAAFLFSAIPGYRQLAWLALLSIVFSVAIALLLLPAFIKHQADAGAGRWKLPDWTKRQAGVICAIALLAFVSLLPSLSCASFESDMALLDGTEKKYLEQEERFQEVWGQGDAGQAMVVVGADNLEGALQANDWVYHEITARLPDVEVVSFARIWKSADERRQNLQNWKQFWTPERIAAVRRRLVRAGAGYGFTEDAFDPFLKQLAEPPAEIAVNPKDNQILSELQQRFIQPQGNRIYAFTYVPDTKGNIRRLQDLPQDKYKPMIISRASISQTLTNDYSREISRVAILACSLVLMSCALLLRNIRMTLISLVPVAFGVVCILALTTALGRPMTVVTLFAAIVVIGLCIDYGIFAVHSYAHNLKVGTFSAITLSAGTTLIGAATLLSARHPALFSIGLTLLGGIAGGYVAAIIVVPAFSRLIIERKISANDSCEAQ